MIHIAVNFHYVGMPVFPHPGIHGLSIPDFRACVESMIREYDPVSLPDVLHASEGGRALPERSCLITFDDGLRCQMEHAVPVLDELRVPAAFFVMAGPFLHGVAPLVHTVHWCRAHFGNAAILAFIDQGFDEGWIPSLPHDVDMAEASKLNPYDDAESSKLKYFLSRSISHDAAARVMHRFMRHMHIEPADFIDTFYMSGDDVRALASRGMVGSHAVSHIPLAGAPPDVIRTELSGSRACLEDLSGREVRALSYPYGIADSVTREVAQDAADAGYVAAYTMERAFNTSLDDALLLARIDCRDVEHLPSYGASTRYRVSGSGMPPASAP
jgi:peptidoglycan/xylan/chitin deacetylase (PgdA/CDA1 family)